MSTALDIIKRSMRLVGALGAAETPASEDAEDNLEILNTMLDAFSIERLMVYSIQKLTYTWAASQQTRTIGLAGLLVTAYPTKIDSAYVTVDSQNYPLEILEDRTSYDSLVSQTTSTSTIPEYFFWDKTYPTANMYLYPIPSASLTLQLNTWLPLQSFADLTTVVSLPPGYRRMLDYNLAVEIDPEYLRLNNPSVLKLAAQSKGNLKSLNQPNMISQIDFGLGRRHNILNGT